MTGRTNATHRMSRVLSLLFCQLTISISLVAAAPIEPPNELVSQNQAFNQAFASGDYYGALDAALKSLRVTEANYPENHSYTAIAATNLAISYRALGRYDEAQPLYHRALRINRVLYGEKHKETISNLNSLAVLNIDRHRFDEAEIYSLQALQAVPAIQDDELFSFVLNTHAAVLTRQYRFSEAERFYRDALSLAQNAGGQDGRGVSVAIGNLAISYQLQGRHVEALSLFEQAYARDVNNLGDQHPQTTQSKNAYALALENVGELSKAEDLFSSTYKIQQTILGVDHPITLVTLNNLGANLSKQGMFAKAETTFATLLHLQSNRPKHGALSVAVTRQNLAAAQMEQGKFVDARRNIVRALDLKDSLFGSQHEETAKTRELLAYLYWLQKDHERSLAIIRQVSTFRAERLRTRSVTFDIGARKEFASYRGGFELHAQLLHEVSSATNAKNQLTELFEVLQLAKQTSNIAYMVQQMAARRQFTSTPDRDAARTAQDIIRELAVLNERYLKAISLGDLQAETLKSAIASSEDKLKTVTSRLQGDKNGERLLAANQTLDLQRAQKLLKTGEAILIYLLNSIAPYNDFRTTPIALLVTKQSVHSAKLNSSSTKIGELVDKARQVAGGRVRGVAQISEANTGEGGASELHDILVEPFAEYLTSINRLTIVSDGSLHSLPYAVLESSDDNQYRWLVERFDLSVLPSINLILQREYQDTPGIVVDRFIGFGDPDFRGQNSPKMSMANLNKRGFGDAQELRTLAPLPETRQELTRLASSFPARKRDLYFGSDATEKKTKSLNGNGKLSNARILAFATHGLVAGEISTFDEPGLVLTPPSEGSQEDDGLLTVSEINEFKINAELVVLSACNTAAGINDSAEGLSGLASAFFFSGATALLVTHTPILSDAAVDVTTDAQKAKNNTPSLDWSAAFSRSIREQIKKGRGPEYWGSFQIVGP